MIDLTIIPIVDFSKLLKTDKVTIEILYKTHKFSPDGGICGNEQRYNPIIGSNVYILMMY